MFVPKQKMKLNIQDKIYFLPNLETDQSKIIKDYLKK